MFRRLTIAAAAAASVLLVIAGCSSGAASPTATQPAPTATANPNDSWQAFATSLNAVLATPDLAVGTRRFAFVLSDDSGIVRFPIVKVASYFCPGGDCSESNRVGPVGDTEARFYDFPLGVRGIDVATLKFDRVGKWEAVIPVPRPNGTEETVRFEFQVKDRTASVDVGQKPPASKNHTLADVASIDDLTTGSLHDPALYKSTIADAIQSGRPTVVVFASPAFCTNAICGPQVEVESDLEKEYGNRVNFIHVDLYDNPNEIGGDLNKAIPSPLLQQWGLASQEWTFVMDSTGTVTARFENFAPRAEVEPAIKSALGS